MNAAPAERVSPDVTAQLRVELDAVDARLGGVADRRQAVQIEKRELEVVPVLAEDRAIEAEPAAPRGLQADLVVLQVVRLVRRERRCAVHAARPEAFRPGGVDHLLIAKAVGSVELEDRILLVDALVEILAGCRATLVHERHKAGLVEACIARQVRAQRLAVAAAAAEIIGDSRSILRASSPPRSSARRQSASARRSRPSSPRRRSHCRGRCAPARSARSCPPSR